MEAAATEIEIVPPAPPVKALAKPTTPRAIVMAEALKEDTEQRALLQSYVREHMREGTDYGVIPGTQKPTLLKPGAEKLTDLFRCTPTFDLLEKVEDWDKGLFHYTFRVRIASRDAGTVLAEGFGSANSREGRYRWRDSRRRCPKCNAEAICRSKFPPRDDPSAEPGWYCYDKKGGCGANFAADDTAITGQTSGKVENDDVFTLVNTILKMAKKRALVDGAIALARCSDIFTQDVEDFAEEGQHEAPRAASRPAPRRDAPRKVEAKAPDAEPPAAPKKDKPAVPAHVAALWKRAWETYGAEQAKPKWDAAAVQVFGKPAKSSHEWTLAECLDVEHALFPVSDVPF